MECPYCGVQLHEDGTVDRLPGEPDQHYQGCNATFTVEAHDRDGNLVDEYFERGDRPWQHYGPARDFMKQRHAMSGPRLTWRIV